MLGQPSVAASEADDSACRKRAVYYTPANGFAESLPQVPRHVFLAERDRAFDPATGTAAVPLDLSATLQTDYPATTPNLLARYVRLAAGDGIRLALRSSGEAWYVIEGHGTAAKAGEQIRWAAGDVFVLPGGGETELRAGDGDCVLYVVSDEPALAWLGVEPPAPGGAAVQAMHFPAAACRRALDEVHARSTGEKLTGKVVIFTGPGVERTKTATRTISFALNSLEPGGVQEPHRHNATALTLCVQGEGVYSVIEGERVDWHLNAVMVTPPAEAHAHHNAGSELMLSIVAQDGGLFYNARAVGFAFA